MLLFSCSKEEYIIGDSSSSQNQGYVKFSIAADYTTVTRAGTDAPVLDPDKFSFSIDNSWGIQIHSWNKFSDIKDKKVTLEQGTYTARAWYGDSTAMGFNLPYFEGKEEFVVKRLKEHSDVQVTCRQGNAKVVVVWGDTLKSDYVQYYATLTRANGKEGEVVFTKRERKAGYVPVGGLNLNVRMIDEDGIERTYNHPTPITVAAQDSLTLKIESKKLPDKNGYLDITYSIDMSTIDKSMFVTVPGYLLAKPAPTIASVGFDEANTVEFWAGDVNTPLKVMINAQAFLDACWVKISSPYLDESLLEKVDLINDYEESLLWGSATGIVWDEELAYQRYSTIDLTQFAKSLRVSDNNESVECSSFTISVADARGKYSDESVFRFLVKRPSLVLSEIPQYDMWATKAYVELQTDVDNLDLFKFESVSNGNAAPLNAELVSESGNVKRFLISGLSPATSYSIRANYCDGFSYTNEVAVKTESALQLANGNMDTWSDEDWTTYSAQTIYHYFAGSSESNKSWGTRNSVTMNGVHSNIASTSNQVVAYKWNSGTIPTDDAVSGKAAEIRTMALANFSVKNGTFSSVLAALRGKRSDMASNVLANCNVYAGYLYTGASDLGSSTVVSSLKGIAHQSRPATVKFSYKYSPYNGDKCKIYAKVFDASGNVIATTNEFVSGEGVSSYKDIYLPLTYSNTKAKAASILVFFQSGTNENKNYVVHVEGSFSVNPWPLDSFVGSVLKVDNIELVY